jgi:tyrosyl-tRNA synthetase
MCTLKCNIALHADTITSANGTYKISQESARIFLKTKGTSPRDYLKPQTKVRKIIVLTSLTPAPPVKASPGA